jgi:tRNA dimethylallyltransferase
VSPLGAQVAVTAVALQMSAAALGDRLARRVDAQFAAGLLDEVTGLLARGVPRTARPFGGLVYRQVVEYLDGVRDLAATRDLIVQENRRYARRQLIWFRKEPNLTWFDGPGELPDVQATVLRWLADRGL